MSTPAVAGAVALYLERFPGASNQEIRDALLSTAADDEFTNQIDYFGALPNNYWGYGKLDVFAAMTEATPTYVAKTAILPIGSKAATATWKVKSGPPPKRSPPRRPRSRRASSSAA